MSRAELTSRLGVDPSQWDFHGQVYATPNGMTRLCALSLEETRICFTIKPKSGRGRMTISDRSIVQFERWNPDLYVKLQTGLMFIAVQDKAVEASFREQKDRNRIRSAEKRYNDLKADARKRINDHRKTIKKGALPEYLQAMKDILQRPSPYFKADENRALWFDQESVAIEQAIRFTNSVLTPSATESSTSDAVPTPPVSDPTTTTLSPIPEIEF